MSSRDGGVLNVKGKFITFEGPEGSGKTSVIKHVAAHLESEGRALCLTREPGGSPIAEKIRDIILDVGHDDMDARTEALLYAAARRQHLVEIVFPALKEGRIVLCDRFVDSSLAYQGYGRELGVDTVFGLNAYAIEDRLPDLTLFIDVPPETGLDRVFSNGRKVDLLDLESLAFHTRVYEGYQALIARYPERIKVVDGTRPLDEVVSSALEHVTDHLKKA